MVVLYKLSSLENFNDYISALNLILYFKINVHTELDILES